MLSGTVLSVAAGSDLVVEGAVHTRGREDQSTRTTGNIPIIFCTINIHKI